MPNLIFDSCNYDVCYLKRVNRIDWELFCYRRYLGKLQ
jgi:hypothetical protein